jgi:hypothetical protein
MDVSVSFFFSFRGRGLGTTTRRAAATTGWVDRYIPLSADMGLLAVSDMLSLICHDQEGRDVQEDDEEDDRNHASLSVCVRSHITNMR